MIIRTNGASHDPSEVTSVPHAAANIGPSAIRAVDLIRSTMLAVPHGFSTRVGGVSTGRYAALNLGPKSGDAPEFVRANRIRFLVAAGLGGISLLVPRQVHSADVTVHRTGETLPGGMVVDGDAVITDAMDVALMVLAADCAAVLLHDPVRGVIGAVHAGWRGTAGRIVMRAIEQMQRSFGSHPSDIRAAIGPAVGRCCYEVGPEVVAALDAATPDGIAAHADPLPHGKARVDIGTANAVQLRAAGVVKIDHLRLCTACNLNRFYSHRREGEPTGRNAAVISQTGDRSPSVMGEGPGVSSHTEIR